ncbi:hypothetical protein N9M97_02830 [Planktomarina temperata]|nr:hypothetical protein [Planktomarina temperata]
MKITFSYDCEGNWGFVDFPNQPLSGYSCRELNICYEFLTDIHIKNGIPAQFAFVALYAMKPEERAEYVRTNLRDMIYKYPNLLKRGSMWEGFENLTLVKQKSALSDLIKISSHSLTHIPITHLTELQSIREYSDSRKLLQKIAETNIENYIFPRNQIKRVLLCKNYYKGFRNTYANTTFQRGKDFLRSVSGIDILPSNSEFVFWKSGARKYFSDIPWYRMWEVRMQNLVRGRNIMDTVHVWSHPHNAMTDPSVIDRISWLCQLLQEHRQYLSLSNSFE